MSPPTQLPPDPPTSHLPAFPTLLPVFTLAVLNALLIRPVSGGFKSHPTCLLSDQTWLPDSSLHREKASSPHGRNGP